MKLHIFTKRRLVILNICALCINNIQAQVTLPKIFADHMVLQQKGDVPIWGWGDASKTIKIVGSWSPQDTMRVVVASGGRWKITLKTGSAGAPFSIHNYGKYGY